ncbi:MAG: ester cyclase [bacterium]
MSFGALQKGLTMSSQDLTQVAREIVTGYSTANWTALKGLFTPAAIYNELGSQRRIQGPDAIIEALQGWKKTMTDSQGKVTSAFASGDTVAMQITWTGTHDGTFTGPGGTVPPTGKRQTTPAAMIVKFSGNKVSEIHHYFDMLTFLQQIGAMPATAART